MGILNTVGEIAGAVAAVEGAEKLDPDAGLLTKAAAAVAGFKGAEAIEGMLEKKKEDQPEQQADDTQATDGSDTSQA
ncbi:hypothetical protein HT746_22005 [Burkholderia pyrrocinia]|uniref:hypothetical protein n=1 Tax=Burkholderia pyrrocinia TaxID=60550 RepID=UPI001575D9E6|nr:hypothetical protein [Burkholderia pyrrocinia]NTX29765.1 hypothetical protein [Burkholderia pyrrocinia]QVN19957.1 hypothetical protein JYG32_15510 [Burkholderia pyrrocinia]